MKKILIYAFLCIHMYAFSSSIDDRMIQAASKSEYDKVIELIKKGADVNHMDVIGYTDMSLKNRAGETAVELAYKDAATPYTPLLILLRTSGYTRDMDLMYAAVAGDSDLFYSALENGT